MDTELEDIIESIINTDFDKEMKKISIFERCIEINKCINCNKKSTYICLLDNKYYCWYHAYTWK